MLGQGQDKLRAAAVAGGAAQVAAETAGELAGDAQAETGACVRGGEAVVDTVELFEDALALRGRHAGPAVADTDGRAGLVATQRHGHLAAVGGWTFTFTPRDTDLSASLGTISVSGQADRVNTIVMAKSPRQRVEITVTDATPRAEFTADEIARYFR